MGKTFIRELLLYTEKIGKKDIHNLIVQLTKQKIPFLGFIDFSSLFSITPRFLIRKTGNTIELFLKLKKDVFDISYLIFPFRLGKIRKIKKIKTSLISFPLFVFALDPFIEFMLKGRLNELSFSVIRILGKSIGFGYAKDEDLNKFFILVPDPEDFLKIDLEKYPSIYIDLLEPIPKTIAFKSDYPLFIGENKNTIGLENFSSLQHTLVIGESGSGKSVFLRMYIKALRQKYGEDVSLIIIDPHGEFKTKFPGEKHIIDFRSEYIEPMAIEGEYSPMFAQLISQLIASSIGEENKYVERVLFHSVHLLGSIGKLNLENLLKLLTDESARMEFIVETEIDEVKAFFDTEFSDIYIHHFNEAILPITNFVSEYQLYIGKLKEKRSLLDLINKNETVILSFDPNFFGKKMIKFFGSSIINQMYILAITNKLKKPVLLVIDEVSRVETPILKDILAETRKFNLFLVLATQYLGQLKQDVLNAIVGNIHNVIAFKLHKKDADLLAGMMEIKIEEHFKKIMTTSELEEKKKEMFVRLDNREAIVRLFDGTKYLFPVKVKTVPASEWLSDEPKIKFKSRLVRKKGEEYE